MKQSLTLLAKQIKLDRIEKQLPVFDAGLGENPMPPPESMVLDVKKFSHLKHYTDAKGIASLKNILGDYLLVGNGLKPLIYILQLAFSILYPNGTIVHLQPQWVSYKEQTNIIRCNTVSVPCDENDWKVKPEVLEDVLKNINGEILLLFNNPNNPSGSIYNKMETESIAKITNKYKCLVFYDSIYSELVYPEYRDSFENFNKYNKNCIIGSSLSKTFGCGGYRFGWLIFSKTHEFNLYKVCHSLASSIYSCPSILFQHVTVNALKNNLCITKHLDFQHRMFYNVSRMCCWYFDKLNIRYSKIQAAWYTLLDFSYYSEKLKSKNINNSNDLSFALLNDIGLITVSGTAFNISKNYVLRYSLVDIKDIDIENDSYDSENIEEGLIKLERWTALI